MPRTCAVHAPCGACVCAHAPASRPQFPSLRCTWSLPPLGRLAPLQEFSNIGKSLVMMTTWLAGNADLNTLYENAHNPGAAGWSCFSGGCPAGDHLMPPAGGRAAVI